ncbi:HNH endonuclease [Pseudomonas turukhanskensis]|uniref:Restriction endonuclease n=1 Tax=Pseudomonas turukhanskensis TaxID=1806536 RepID=A0A9W6K4X1_9PSED|nr:HNH endonuclease [Pseudomonas turukhanskensis]GLK88308.1 restriction endonuclease [Pseudomonas turukhanskensis]
MPSRPGRICTELGCGKATAAASHYCPTHKAVVDARRAERMKGVHRQYNQKRDESDAFYKTEKWRKFSLYYRRLHPLCRECEAHGRTTASALVDHIKAYKTNPELAFDWTNVRALCKPCHNQVGERVGLSAS